MTMEGFDLEDDLAAFEGDDLGASDPKGGLSGSQLTFTDALNNIPTESDGGGEDGCGIDLLSNEDLVIDISDALSERDVVMFTIRTKTTLPMFRSHDVSVVRNHDEFVWLHDIYYEDPAYAGIIIPPVPPKPDFHLCRQKLQDLTSGDENYSKDERQKLKESLEREYLASFKKAVAAHEVFLHRIAAHPLLRRDLHFAVFLEHKELQARLKGKVEKINSFVNFISKSADSLWLTNRLKDVDEYFEHEKTFLTQYNTTIKTCAAKCEPVIKYQRNISDQYISVATQLSETAILLDPPLNSWFLELSSTVDNIRKFENRSYTDGELFLFDTLKFYYRDTEAALDLLRRRFKALSLYDNANKNVDKARLKGKDVTDAESNQQLAAKRFEVISESAKQELEVFRTKRIDYFQKHLVKHAELQIQNNHKSLNAMQEFLSTMKDTDGLVLPQSGL